ncbi:MULTISPECIES: DUF4381 domain-containing protein [unclassified Legionella]|uniref:DUF4381 domain-containing protein n=1 Tax=unclassified Legionella TaxID=2622702 RepID=UPI001E40BFEA|nr:DUF4381 domain-containing protein [Legionella sp. 31fI33]
MTESAALAKLRDIQLPNPISWWPMAPGWYFLISLVVLSVIFLLYILRRSYLFGRAKREALQLLTHYQQAYEQVGNSQRSSMEISELLRRVALVYFPRDRVAGLQGEAWLAFLNETAKGVDFNSVRPCLLEAPYQTGKNMDLNPLFICAEKWIKQRRKPCSN